MVKKHRLLIVLITAGLLVGCADLSYYLHSVNGHLSVMRSARAIEEVLNDPNTPSDLAERLRLVNRIREFAITELGLPSSGSYVEYADLQRDYVVKNLFAAPEFSIEAHQWCYPIVGCAGYRGYFDEQRLDSYVARLDAQGFDTYVARVPAYSTLGWFDDPVLNTFIRWPEHHLAGLIFHELSHQVLYIDGDTQFNESFAVAVQQLATERWLQHGADGDRLALYRDELMQRAQVIALIAGARQDLADLYRKPLSEEGKRAAKRRYMDQLRQQYLDLSATFARKDRFAAWFESELNNAKLLSIATYHSNVAAFRNMHRQLDGDFHRFLAYVKNISQLDQERRQRCVDAWQVSTTGASLPADCPPLMVAKG